MPLGEPLYAYGPPSRAAALLMLAGVTTGLLWMSAQRITQAHSALAAALPRGEPYRIESLRGGYDGDCGWIRLRGANLRYVAGESTATIEPSESAWKAGASIDFRTWRLCRRAHGRGVLLDDAANGVMLLFSGGGRGAA